MESPGSRCGDQLLLTHYSHRSSCHHVLDLGDQIHIALAHFDELGSQPHSTNSGSSELSRWIPTAGTFKKQVKVFET
jgi:hypothetical protein